jgi:nitric oxide reductase NorQ protein
LLTAADGFMLVISYNPGYQRMLKDLKPSTRQRFVALDLDFPSEEREAIIIERESGADGPTARALASLGRRLRELRDRGLAEVPSTRLLIAAAGLIASGIPVREACYTAVVAPLSDDPALVGAMRDLVDATFVPQWPKPKKYWPTSRDTRPFTHVISGGGTDSAPRRRASNSPTSPRASSS